MDLLDRQGTGTSTDEVGSKYLGQRGTMRRGINALRFSDAELNQMISKLGARSNSCRIAVVLR